jgi:hypothetical protein
LVRILGRVFIGPSPVLAVASVTDAPPLSVS